MLTTALGVAGGWPVPVVLTIAGTLLVVESGTLIGIVVPGTTVLVALGLWSHAAPQAPVRGILVAAVATVTGAHLGWWRGRADASAGYSSGGVLGRPRQFAATRAAQAGHWLTERGPYARMGPVLIVSGSAWATASCDGRARARPDAPTRPSNSYSADQLHPMEERRVGEIRKITPNPPVSGSS